MIRSYRTLAFAAILVTFALASCRTSQQESRSAANTRAQSQASSQQAPGGGGRMDSLLMIERKLVEVIDSMSSLVESDHLRIQNLEQELLQLRSQMSAPAIAMPPPAPF